MFAGAIDIVYGMESVANNVRKLQGAQPSKEICSVLGFDCNNKINQLEHNNILRLQ